MLLENGKRDEEMKLAAEVVCPQHLPETEHVRPVELTLEPHEQHAKEEEEIGRFGRLEMQVQLGVHELHEVVER